MKKIEETATEKELRKWQEGFEEKMVELTQKRRCSVKVLKKGNIVGLPTAGVVLFDDPDMLDDEKKVLENMYSLEDSVPQDIIVNDIVVGFYYNFADFMITKSKKHPSGLKRLPGNGFRGLLRFIKNLKRIVKKAEGDELKMAKMNLEQLISISEIKIK